MVCQLATVPRFRLFAKAAVQEARGRCSDFGMPNFKSTALSPLREGNRARSAISDCGSSSQPGTALLPCSLACSLAVHNLLPAALQCAACCLATCSHAALQPAACSLAVQRSGLFAKAVLQSNQFNDLISLFNLIGLITSILARTLVCDVQVCSNLAARQPPVWVGGIGRRP